MARQCIKPMYCCICKSGQHLAERCLHSWKRAVQPVGAHEETAEENLANDGDHEGTRRANSETCLFITLFFFLDLMIPALRKTLLNHLVHLPRQWMYIPLAVRQLMFLNPLVLQSLIWGPIRLVDGGLG